MPKKPINNQDNVEIEAEYKDKNRKAKLNAKAHGKHGTKRLVFIIAIIAISVIVILVVGNITFAVVNYLSNKKEITNEDSIDEVTTVSGTIQEFTEIITVETEPLDTNDESFLKTIENIEDDFKTLMSTKDSEKYSSEDATLIQEVSEREKEYGEYIPFIQLDLNIKDREKVASRTPNSRLYFLLGKDYQKLSYDDYSGERDKNQVECLLESNQYYKESLKYFDLSFLLCEEENMRVSKSTIFKYLSQNYINLGNIDKSSSYPHFCNALVTHTLYKENYKDEKGYVSSNFDIDNWYYTQGRIYFGIYESYPNENDEELQYIYEQCEENYLSVSRSSQDYEQAQSDSNYLKSKYGYRHENS